MLVHVHFAGITSMCVNNNVLMVLVITTMFHILLTFTVIDSETNPEINRPVTSVVTTG